MRTTRSLIQAGAAALIMCVAAAPSAFAWRHHHYLHHHYYQHVVIPNDQPYNYDRDQAALEQQYGSYPNIRYFHRNGHVYYHDLDTGQDFLVHW